MIVEEQGQQCFSCHKTGHKASYLPNACTFHTQNFKLNLMVDMLALKLAEAEYPQETPGASVSLLGQPAKEAPVQWGVA